MSEAKLVYSQEEMFEKELGLEMDTISGIGVNLTVVKSLDSVCLMPYLKLSSGEVYFNSGTKTPQLVSHIVRLLYKDEEELPDTLDALPEKFCFVVKDEEGNVLGIGNENEECTLFSEALLYWSTTP